MITGGGMLFIAFGLMTTYIEEKNIVVLCLALLLGIIGAIIFYLKIKEDSNYSELYKKEVITNFINKIFPNFEYLPYESLENMDNMVKLYESAHFDTGKFNRSSSNDYIYGKHKDTGISICDLDTFYEYQNEKNETVQEARFSGIFANVKASCYKDIDIKILNRDKSIKENRNIVEIDNDEFNNNFVIISNSKIEAFQLITADVIQLLNDILKNNDIKFDISISNQNIYFRFYTIPIFEPSMNEPVMKKESFYRYYILLKFILKFSEVINKTYKDLNI